MATSLDVYVAGAHRHAMDAKERIFRAQDNLSLAYTRAAAIVDAREQRATMRRLDRMQRRLAKVRRELEQLDNDHKREGARS